MPTSRSFLHRPRSPSQPKIDLALLVNQSHALDHHAELLQQVKDAGGNSLIIWPSDPGPLQGTFIEAKKHLESLGSDLAIVVMSPEAILEQFRQARIGVLLTQTPFLTDHYAPSFRQVFDSVPLMYLGYGLDVFSGSLSLSKEALAPFELILAESPAHQTNLVNSGIAREKVLFLGHPSVYRLRHQAPIQQSAAPTILWQLHWTQEFSTWEQALPVILQLAQRWPDTQIRISPHPLLEELTGLSVPEGYQKASARLASTTRVLAELRVQPNVIITYGPLLQDIWESDICVTDGKAMIGFFGVTGKPLAVTKNVERRSKILPEFEALAEHWVEEDSPENVALWLERIIQDWAPGLKSVEAVSMGEIALPTFESSPGSSLLTELRRLSSRQT